MTRINIIKFSNGYRIEVLGHSGYAEKGKDIVCASISTLVQYMEMVMARTCKHELEKYEEGTFILNIKTNEDEFKKEGFDTFDYRTRWWAFVTKLVSSFVEFVKELQEQYPEYVKLEEIEENKCLTK